MKRNLSIAILAFALSATSANACSYLYRTPQEKLADADVVFVGTVIGGNTTELVPFPGPNGELPGFGSMSISNTTFTVNKVWKGNVPNTLDVYSSHTMGTSCGSFRGIVNHQYLVFAHYSTSTRQYTVTEIGAEDITYSEVQKTLAILGPGTAVIGTTSTSTPSVIWPGTIQNTVGKFYMNLKLGMRHVDVRRLQTLLNRAGYTVAEQGVGSLGQEGMYFGAQTMRALIQFQNAHKAELGISRGTGFFGPSTRALLNK